MIILFVPYVCPLIFSGLATQLIFDTKGLFTLLDDQILGREGILSSSPLFHSATAFIILSILSIWQFFPFAFILFYVSNLRIEKTTIESAINDGCGAYSISRYIMWPFIRKTVFVALVLRLLFMFNKYEFAAILAKSNTPRSIDSLYLFPLWLRTLYLDESLNRLSLIISLVILLILSILILISKKHLFQENEN